MIKIATPLAATAAVIALGLAAGSARAEESYCTGQGTPMAREAVIAKLREMGYQKIRRLDMEHGCYEAKGFGKDGKRVEIYVEPATGQIVKIKG